MISLSFREPAEDPLSHLWPEDLLLCPEDLLVCPVELAHLCREERPLRRTKLLDLLFLLGSDLDESLHRFTFCKSNPRLRAAATLRAYARGARQTGSIYMLRSPSKAVRVCNPRKLSDNMLNSITCDTTESPKLTVTEILSQS